MHFPNYLSHPLHAIGATFSVSKRYQNKESSKSIWAGYSPPALHANSGNFFTFKRCQNQFVQGTPSIWAMSKRMGVFSGSPSLVWPTLHLLPKSEDPIYSLSRLPKKIKFVRITRISQGGSLMNLVRGLSDHCRIIKVKQLFLWGRGGGGSVHPNFLNPFEYRKLLPDKSFPKRIGTTPNP